MNLPSSPDPNFFGKDSFVPFIGQVEDVNDPKRSGRVKVRCLGWHPSVKTGDEGLSTDDIPWSRTCMPVTHPQQVRSGGKHGLIPGSWVVGFFADGNDANDPFVLASFNFTAKASDENNRQEIDVDVSSGRIPDEVPGYMKVNPIKEPNTGLDTKEELQSGTDDEGDKARDSASLDDSTDGSCPIKESAFATTKLEEKKAENPHSQNFNTVIGDGLCGNLMNGRAKISDAISSMLPSGAGRFVDGDELFDLNGNAINMNGIMNKLSGIISSVMKDTIQKQKGFLQKTTNKLTHSTGIFTAASRSPLTAVLADQLFSTQFDMFNQLIDKSLDQLQEQVMGSLQNLNNQQQSSKGSSNAGGEYGSSRDSVILDLEPIDIADSIIIDVEIIYNQNVEEAYKQSEEKVKKAKEKVLTLEEKLKSTRPEYYECIEDMEDDITSDYDEAVQAIQDSYEADDSGGGGGSGGGGFDLGQASQFLQMVLNMDFTINPQVFNKSGIGVLDSFTQEGCNPHDLYNTITGYTGSQAGVDSQSTGGGSESGKSSKDSKSMYKNTGFGGKPGPVDKDKTTSSPILGSPRVKKQSQSERDTIIKKFPSFADVDYYEVGRSYELRGEQLINGQLSNNSRVLVNNQPDPTENGIYQTSRGEWTRPVDADTPTKFKRKKRVRVKSLPVEDNLLYYSAVESPKVGFDDIQFQTLNDSSEFTQSEKDAFNPLVEVKPAGSRAIIMTTSKPSSDKEAAINYVYGIPNTIVVTKPGSGYYYDSKLSNRNYPSIFIDGYIGTPIPVVDPVSGELVTVLINYRSFSSKSIPSVSIFADDSSIGISTDDPNYDVVLAGFYVSNTGVNYSKDTKIKIIDKDRILETAFVRPRVKNGRITFVEVINNGTGFKRIPKVVIENKGKGRGCKLYPIMGLKAKESNPSVKKLQQNVALSISPSPTNTNLFTTIDETKL